MPTSARRWSRSSSRSPGVALDGDSLVATLKAKMANFKVPKALFVAAELPRNAMGKVQKNLLREQHAGQFRQA
jgi:malonyl-CoA/methylmalonyl-CoA synthetase